jgi:hypothetical protein
MSKSQKRHSFWDRVVLGKGTHSEEGSGAPGREAEEGPGHCWRIGVADIGRERHLEFFFFDRAPFGVEMGNS